MRCVKCQVASARRDRTKATTFVPVDVFVHQRTASVSPLADSHPGVVDTALAVVLFLRNVLELTFGKFGTQPTHKLAGNHRATLLRARKPSQSSYPAPRWQVRSCGQVSQLWAGLPTAHQKHRPLTGIRRPYRRCAQPTATARPLMHWGCRNRTLELWHYSIFGSGVLLEYSLQAALCTLRHGLQHTYRESTTT